MIESVGDDDVTVRRHCDAVWKAELAPRCAVLAKRHKKFYILRKDLNAMIMGVAHDDVAAAAVYGNPPRRVEFCRALTELAERPHKSLKK